ncbi:hypothetical protein [Actinosynnema mirum]|uniref:Uncharacterized protein n=1 Tax=Actinosynnema mirum (strain ATCC 29888 / DSM 43827 / JCM 3225 / NBRC 14064 / NCIMB 13271 / NRRL B-12336 / IMRU 3971 / 101) TaxID=446462 RepID=C6WJW7_ACTMD|nr:hypothetical protein [Actinosynnema mirum]ACU36342.1 hypothetical protein Amir_2402 [Actinosynnema mirum DSM 43827]
MVALGRARATGGLTGHAVTALLVLPCLVVGLIAYLGREPDLPGRAAPIPSAIRAEDTPPATAPDATTPPASPPSGSPTSAAPTTGSPAPSTPPPSAQAPPVDTPAPRDLPIPPEPITDPWHLDGRWIAQLFSVAVGAPPGTLETTLSEFSLRTGTDVPLLLSSDYSSLRPGYLVGFHPGPFADSAEVETWCASANLPTADCLPRKLTR